MQHNLVKNNFVGQVPEFDDFVKTFQHSKNIGVMVDQLTGISI